MAHGMHAARCVEASRGPRSLSMGHLQLMAIWYARAPNVAWVLVQAPRSIESGPRGVGMDGAPRENNASAVYEERS